MLAKLCRPHILALFALALVCLSGTEATLQRSLTDFRFRWFPRNATGDVVLVQIDPRSLDKVGVWPWPRSVHAQLIRELHAFGAKDIAFDIDFSSRSNEQSDRDFLDALKAADGTVVLAAFQQANGAQSELHLNEPLPAFAENSWPAAVNVRADPDGVVRRYWTGEQLGKSYVASIAAVLSHRENISRNAFLIDFSITPQSIPVVSYIDALNGTPEAVRAIKGKSVIVGGTAIELGDRFNVPLHGVISGPMLQAYATESLAQRRDLHISSPLLVPLELLALAVLMHVLWRRKSGAFRAVFLAGAVFGIETAATLLQAAWPVAWDTAYLHVAIGAYFLALVLEELDIRGLFRRIAENRFQRFAMSIGDGLVCVDPQWRITTWNASATRIFGYETDEVLGKSMMTIWHSESNGARRDFLATLSRELLQQAGGHTVELTGRRKDGSPFPMEVCFSGWDTPEGFHYGAVIRDISVRKREEMRIRYLAEHDTLTGLINRDTLDRRAGELAATAPLALVVIGVSNFHQLNDTLGNASGDEVLFAIASRLKTLLPPRTLLARLYGDEFAVLLAGNVVVNETPKLCAAIATAFDGVPVEAAGRQNRIVLHLGVACYPQDCKSVEELFGCAHMALGQAKTAKENCVAFDRSMRIRTQERLALEAELAQALSNGEFELFYQPQVRMTDRALIGVEALIRWRHPQRGLLAPAQFMPIVNGSALSDPVAVWVIQTACRQGVRWERAGHTVRVAVNLAPSLIQSGTLPDLLADILRETGLSPANLEVEVTEDILLADADGALETFRKVQALGVRSVFDDFGTGYASLSYLRAFPLDGLKIDRSFVTDLKVNSTDAAIVSSTIALAKHLSLAVVAEGIEDKATAELLREMGCDEGQGYFFSRPVPVGELNAKYGLDDVTAAQERQPAPAAA